LGKWVGAGVCERKLLVDLDGFFSAVKDASTGSDLFQGLVGVNAVVACGVNGGGALCGDRAGRDLNEEAFLDGGTGAVVMVEFQGGGVRAFVCDFVGVWNEDVFAWMDFFGAAAVFRENEEGVSHCGLIDDAEVTGVRYLEAEGKQVSGFEFIGWGELLVAEVDFADLSELDAEGRGGGGLFSWGRRGVAGDGWGGRLRNLEVNDGAACWKCWVDWWGWGANAVSDDGLTRGGRTGFLSGDDDQNDTEDQSQDEEGV
jgi:hypothetical protein